MHGDDLTYGEVGFEAIYKAFKWIQINYKDKDPDCWHNAFNKPGGQFIDLGHGTGRGVLIGALIHPFDRSRGIELLDKLQETSLKMKSCYDKYLKTTNEL